MSDRLKTILAIFLFAGAMLIPLIGLGVGWYNWDIETGLWIAAAIFVSLAALGVVLLFRVQDLTWLTVSIPYLFGITYTLSPDLIPLGGDDAAVTATGSVLAYILALRKDPRTPRWIIVPLILAAGYTAFGGFIPGGLDEIAANLFAVALAGYGINRATANELDE